MRPSGEIAYAHARIRAWRSRLLKRIDVAPLLAAHDSNTVTRALATLHLDSANLTRSLRERLFQLYATAIRTYRQSAPLLLALLRLHEIENVKLLWRTILRNAPRSSIARYWIDLGELAAFDATRVRDLSTLHDAVVALEKTAYAEIAAEVARAYGDDLAASELAFDRWASRVVLSEAARLPNEEVVARALLVNIIRERDLAIESRAVSSYGLSEAASDAARAIQERNPPAANLHALRAERLKLCRRAFVGSPFSVAPAIATILLAEEEARGVRALAERGGDETLDETVTLALAASLMGA